MNAFQQYVRERGTDTFCPVDGPFYDGYIVVTGLIIVGSCPGEEVGEFWFDEDGEIQIRIGGRDGE